MEVNDTVYSAEDLLARSAQAVATKKKVGGSKIQQMLAGREFDTVELSPVAKMLQAQEAKKTKTETPYTEQDWFLQAKVQQLRFQLDFYSRLGGPTADQAISSIEAEIRGILRQQSDKLAASNAEADAKKKELDAKQAEADRFKNLLTPEQLLKKASGTYSEPTSDAVKKLLENSAKALDTSA